MVKKVVKKSAEVRRKKKRMKETMQLLLNLKVPTEEAKEKLMEIGIPEEDATMQSAILLKQVNKAIGGDNESAKFCRDTAGEFIGAEEEKEETNNYNVCIPSKDMPPAFIGIYRSILNREYKEYWLEGRKG